MRVSILESSGLAKPEELEMNKAILNSVYFFSVIYNSPSEGRLFFFFKEDLASL